MSSENYSNCIKFVLRWEGGKVNHPRDPGGKTNQGVTQRTYNAYRRKKSLPEQDVYRMENAERDAIYRKEYWDVAGCDALPCGVDLAVFDIAVNSGPRKAKYFLDRARAGNPAPGVIVARMCDDRLAWLRRLSTWPTFGKGWGNRVRDCKTLASSMARNVCPIRTEMAAKDKVVKQNQSNAGGGVVLGGMAAGLHWLAGMPENMAIVLGGVAVFVVLYSLTAALKARKSVTAVAARVRAEDDEDEVPSVEPRAAVVASTVQLAPADIEAIAEIVVKIIEARLYVAPKPVGETA